MGLYEAYIGLLSHPPDNYPPEAVANIMILPCSLGKYLVLTRGEPASKQIQWSMYGNVLGGPKKSTPSIPENNYP